MLYTSYVGLQAIKSSVILSVNQTYIEKDTSVTLSSDDEIAIIPPISGGYEPVLPLMYATLICMIPS